jgi:hypothetical protein
MLGQLLGSVVVDVDVVVDAVAVADGSLNACGAR